MIAGRSRCRLLMPWLIALVFVVPGHAFAQAFSHTLSFQGRLSGTDGKPVTDGPYAVTFAMYDAEAGGQALWTEVLGVTQIGGVFTATLGLASAFAADLFAGGDRWLSLKIADQPEMTQRFRLTPAPWAIQAANADTVDGLHASPIATPNTLLALDAQGRFPPDALSAAVPRGVIVMWSGNVDDVPAGWALCDGTNGTPDLRDRFILGVRVGENPGETGGSHEVALTVANMPTHQHPFTTTVDGEHKHDFSDGIRPADWGGINGWFSTQVLLAAGGGVAWIYNSTDWSGAHGHTGTTDPQGESAPFDNRPAYYRLAFIMKA